MMRAILVALSLVASAAMAGCQSTPPASGVSKWRFPCGYRAFNAMQCDRLGGMPDTDFNLTGRLLGQ